MQSLYKHDIHFGGGALNPVFGNHPKTLCLRTPPFLSFAAGTWSSPYVPRVLGFRGSRVQGFPGLGVLGVLGLRGLWVRLYLMVLLGKSRDCSGIVETAVKTVYRDSRGR